MTDTQQKHRLSLPADWPFSVARLPFFYGWVIWIVSTLGVIMSMPGQTIGMAVFTDYFIDAFGLSRTQLSVAYLLGTLGSSIFLSRAGRFYDHAGARITVVGACTGLGIFLLFIANIDSLAHTLVDITGLSLAILTFPLILLGYFGVRFCGQGVLTSSSRNVLLVWFEKRRGLISGTHSVFVTLCFSMSPPILAFAINELGWRNTLFILAAIVGLIFNLIALCLLRNTPESCGLLPDGKQLDSGQKTQKNIPAVTGREAKRSPVFWLYACTFAMHALFATAIVFHVVSIFANAGRSAEQAFSYFLPQSIVTVSVNLLASWLSDRYPLKRLLIIKLLGFIVGAWGLINLQYTWGYWLAITGFGTAGGLWGVLMNLAMIRFFGRLHLGEISGLNMTLTVIGSAIGPVLFSLGNDLFGSYNAGIWINIAMLISLLCAALIVNQEEPGRSTN